MSSADVTRHPADALYSGDTDSHVLVGQAAEPPPPHTHSPPSPSNDGAVRLMARTSDCDGKLALSGTLLGEAPLDGEAILLDCSCDSLLTSA